MSSRTSISYLARRLALARLRRLDHGIGRLQAAHVRHDDVIVAGALFGTGFPGTVRVGAAPDCRAPRATWAARA
ncbi:MAG TPA: hypothetical protein VF158_15685 [Longimicrobiales bacterium]